MKNKKKIPKCKHKKTRFDLKCIFTDEAGRFMKNFV